MFYKRNAVILFFTLVIVTSVSFLIIKNIKLNEKIISYSSIDSFKIQSMYITKDLKSNIVKTFTNIKVSTLNTNYFSGESEFEFTHNDYNVKFIISFPQNFPVSSSFLQETLTKEPNKSSELIPDSIEDSELFVKIMRDKEFSNYQDVDFLLKEYFDLTADEGVEYFREFLVVEEQELPIVVKYTIEKGNLKTIGEFSVDLLNPNHITNEKLAYSF